MVKLNPQKTGLYTSQLIQQQDIFLRVSFVLVSTSVSNDACLHQYKLQSGVVSSYNKVKYGGKHNAS